MRILRGNVGDLLRSHREHKMRNHYFTRTSTVEVRPSSNKGPNHIGARREIELSLQGRKKRDNQSIGWLPCAGLTMAGKKDQHLLLLSRSPISIKAYRATVGATMRYDMIRFDAVRKRTAFVESFVALLCWGVRAKQLPLPRWTRLAFHEELLAYCHWLRADSPILLSIVSLRRPVIVARRSAVQQCCHRATFPAPFVGSPGQGRAAGRVR